MSECDAGLSFTKNLKRAAKMMIRKQIFFLDQAQLSQISCYSITGCGQILPQRWGIGKIRAILEDLNNNVGAC
jgi:hypothetical protein